MQRFSFKFKNKNNNVLKKLPNFELSQTSPTENIDHKEKEATAKLENIAHKEKETTAKLESIAHKEKETTAKLESIAHKENEATNKAENIPQIYCLTIIGQVEGHLQLPPHNKTTKYEEVIPNLVMIEQNPDIKGVLVILNTVGGDVEAGLAIAEMISSLSKPTVSIVLGGGHSIGIPIAVSCDYAFMVPSATMTIHPIRLTGLIIGVPQTFEYLEKMQDRVVDFIVSHSNIQENVLKKLMFAHGNLSRDIGTNIVVEDAISSGLINKIGGIKDAINLLYNMIEANN